MSKLFITLLVGLLLNCAFAQVELEFTPPEGVKVTPAALRDARNILQQRLEQLFEAGQKFQVTLGAGTILVRLESSVSVEVETVIELCTAVGRLEFIDSGM
jgi:hypothetical protein